MTWAWLDDGLHESPAITEAGLTALGLYAAATCYCARHLTDGFISRKAVRRLLDGDDWAPVEALLRVDLLEEADGGFTVMGYLKGNQTREVVERRKAEAKERKDRWLEKRRRAAAKARHEREAEDAS